MLVSCALFFDKTANVATGQILMLGIIFVHQIHFRWQILMANLTPDSKFDAQCQYLMRDVKL